MGNINNLAPLEEIKCVTKTSEICKSQVMQVENQCINILVFRIESVIK